MGVCSLKWLQTPIMQCTKGVECLNESLDQKQALHLLLLLCTYFLGSGSGSGCPESPPFYLDPTFNGFFHDPCPIFSPSSEKICSEVFVKSSWQTDKQMVLETTSAEGTASLKTGCPPTNGVSAFSEHYQDYLTPLQYPSLSRTYLSLKATSCLLRLSLKLDIFTAISFLSSQSPWKLR